MKDSVALWFARKSWIPHSFQVEAWNAFERGDEALIQAPTGSGKTYAGLGGVVRSALKANAEGKTEQGLQVIWIAPIRALTKEIQMSAERLVEGTGLNWSVGVRTGDTSNKEKSSAAQEMASNFNYYTGITACPLGHERLCAALRGVEVDGSRRVA